MKKQIMSKRSRRFDEGGFISSESQEMPRARTEDNQEAADKAAGLAASNKEKPSGFFERLRMGNIDDPNSEAYKRLGAGRGRASRVPVEDITPTPVETPKITSRSEGMESVNAAIQARKNAEAEGAKVSNGELIGQAMASNRVAPPVMPVKQKPVKKEFNPTAGEAKDKAAQAAADKITDPNIVKPAVKPIDVNLELKKEPVDVTKLSLSDRIKLDREKSKKGTKTDARSVNQRMREAFGFKGGGSVSKASSRADGIAQRGKTRGKMC